MILESGDRTAELYGITAPTHSSGGLATTAAIPGARHLAIARMGQDLGPITGPLVGLTRVR